MEFTKKQLAKAFKEWNKDCIKNDGDFYEIDQTDKCSEDQAKTLIDYLKQV